MMNFTMMYIYFLRMSKSGVKEKKEQLHSCSYILIHV